MTGLRADRACRAVLVWALALGILGLFGLQGREAVRSADRGLGFTPAAGKRGVLAESVNPSEPALRGGLRPGDEILAVDGRRVASLFEYEAAARAQERGRPVVLRITREGRTLDLAVIPGTPVRWLPLALNGLAALGFLAVALLAWLQGTGLRAGLLFTFCVAVAAEVALPTTVIGRPVLAAAAFAAYYLLTGLQIGVQMHLASLTPERPGWLCRHRWIVPLYYVIGIGLGSVSCATYLAQEVLGRGSFPWRLWSIADLDGWLQHAVLPAWALAITLLLAAQALRHPEPRGRHQAGLVLAATIPWMLFTVGGSALEVAGHELPEWTGAFETLILLCYPVAFFAAIFRYHLFDLELAVRRGLIYTALSGALVVVFYAALGAGGALFSRLVEGPESPWSVSGATLLLGLLFAPLRRALHRLIDRRFFPERYALRRRLVDLAAELPALGKLPRMGERLVERLAAIFLSSSATLLIADPETGLLSLLASTRGDREAASPLALADPIVDRLRRAGRPLPASQLAATGEDPGPGGLAVPLLRQERLVGLLLVGRKDEGRPYPAEELELLSLLAHHVATVLENARLFESATYERLTGLLRREAILEQLDRELERALRYGRPLTLAMADLDHFKQINDRHGHLSGDSLLRRIAQVVAGELRSTDWIGRYGGEEFLLVLPETDLEGAAAVAEKIRSLVQGTPVPMEDGTPARVTVSIGLATLSGAAAGRVTGRDLIAGADRSLYEAKHAGRNRVHPRVA
jgi:diguanylate cyclase (GGDEF)-like protein